MSVKLPFQLKLDSDYHIGTGGPSSNGADSALLRDDDVPVLRGTTLTGLLRDSLWRLLQLEPMKKYRHCQRSGLPKEMDDQKVPAYCGESNKQNHICPLCYLFGSPLITKRWRVGSARPQGLETPTINDWAGQENVIQIIHRARINPRTRRTANNQLFSHENGDGRLIFSFELEYIGNGEPTPEEISLLVATTRNITELGRSRRRGQGRCEITFIGEQKTILEQFETYWLNNEITLNLPQKIVFPTNSVTTTKNNNESSVRVRLIIRTDEPFILAQRGEAGNLFETQKMISGVSLRGVFANQVAQRNDLTDPKIYQDFINLFFRQRIQFTTLYPATLKQGYLYPTIQAPRDFLTCKLFSGVEPYNLDVTYRHGVQGYAQKSVYDHLYCNHPECAERQTPLSPLTDFILIDDTGRLEEDKLSQRTEMHSQISPKKQRVDEDNLFGYTVIETAQYFVGELTFSSTDIWKTFQDLVGHAEPDTSFTIYLGKAQRRGYGKVHAYWQVCSEHDPSTLIGLPLNKRVTDSTEPITLTLLTDTIIRDTWGRYQTSFNEEWLRQELNLEIMPKSLNVFIKSNEIDGFNSHLGLPRQRDLVLEAGSAVGFKLKDPPPDWQTQLVKLEQDGIGLRQQEGFGQIAFNHPIYSSQSLRRQIADPLDIPDALRLATKTNTNEHFLSQGTIKQESWQQIIDAANWQACQDEQFLAVARWIDTNHSQTPNQLINQLEKLGKPDETLTQLIAQYDVARWLQKNAQKSVADITQTLELDNQLIETSQARLWIQNQGDLPVEAIATKADEWQDDKFIDAVKNLQYGARNFDTDKLVSSGVKLIAKLLKKLADEYEAVYHPQGIKMLADRIAAEAKQAQKEDRP